MGSPRRQHAARLGVRAACQNKVALSIEAQCWEQQAGISESALHPSIQQPHSSFRVSPSSQTHLVDGLSLDPLAGEDARAAQLRDGGRHVELAEHTESD